MSRFDLPRCGWGPAAVENKIKSLTGVKYGSDQLCLLHSVVEVFQSISLFSKTPNNYALTTDTHTHTHTQSLGREKDTDEGLLK